MFNCIKRTTKNVGVRYSSNDSLFLSDLLKRIDDVTTKASDIAKKKVETKDTNVANKKNVQTKGQAKNNKSAKSKQPSSSFNNQRVVVANHPLRNTFGQRNTSFSNSYISATQSFRAPSQSSGGPRKQSSSRSSSKSFNQRRPKTPAKKKPVFVSEIKTKQLSSKPLTPNVNGDLFLYGKPTTVVACTASRVAALAKEALIDSNYPYKMPKSIIDTIKPSATKNQYLLQKNWSTTLDEDKLASRFDKVVLGKTEQLTIPKKLASDAQAMSSNDLLMKNASISLQDKQTMFDVINGIKSVDAITKNAPWNQQKA